MNKIEELTEKLLNDLALIAPENTGMKRAKIHIAMASVVHLCADECASGNGDSERIKILLSGTTW